MKIVFFGTPEFAVASLDRLVQAGCDLVAVVTMPDKTAGRGRKVIQSDVKKYAVAHGLEVLQPENLKDEKFIERLREIAADLFIVIAFRMLPRAVWQMPPLGTFNLHASLLPKYRGAAPINRAVMNGDTKTGVTTFFLKHEIDTGDIIMQREIDILPEENVGDIHDKLMELGAGMVAETVKAIDEGTVTTQPQPEGEFTPAPKIFAEDRVINWNGKAEDIHNQVRGLSPYPCALAVIEDSNGKTQDVKILNTSLTSPTGENEVFPGRVVTTKKQMWVCTGDGWLEIVTLQPAGKKAMETTAYLLGYQPVKFVQE